MFFLTYLPQVAVLAFISGPLGKLALVYVYDKADPVQHSSQLSPSFWENLTS
jgi:hypothetical protein